MLPSQITDKYWIWANTNKFYPDHTIRGGKWLIFYSIDKIDKTWLIVKKATIEGRLGNISKVSTAKINPNAKNPNTKVICVYTYDSGDFNDVMRIRKELELLGFTQQLKYKTDNATRHCKYVKTSKSKTVCLYTV